MTLEVADAGTVVPSPKSKAYESACPCGSLDADASAVTVTGAVPLDGLTVSAAVGGWVGGGGAETVTVFWSVAVSPDAFATVTVTV